MNIPRSIKGYQALLVATAVQKVMEVFYFYPEKEFSLSDLAKEAGVQKSNLGGIIASLEKEELVSVEKLSKIWRIKANRASWRFAKSKIVYNLNFIYQSGLVEYLNTVYNHPKSIVLFGSFRKGEDLSNSDIDIAIENDSFKEYKSHGLRGLSEFEKAIGRNIQIHEFNRNLIELDLFNNISNGILLMGFLEVKK